MTNRTTGEAAFRVELGMHKYMHIYVYFIVIHISIFFVKHIPYIYNTHAFILGCMQMYAISTLGKLYIHCSYTFGFGHASFQDDCMGIAFFGSLISHWSHDFASDKFDCNILMVVILPWFTFFKLGGSVIQPSGMTFCDM